MLEESFSCYYYYCDHLNRSFDLNLLLLAFITLFSIYISIFAFLLPSRLEFTRPVFTMLVFNWNCKRKHNKRSIWFKVLWLAKSKIVTFIVQFIIFFHIHLILRLNWEGWKIDWFLIFLLLHSSDTLYSGYMRLLEKVTC